jgi:hypothetical protein
MRAMSRADKGMRGMVTVLAISLQNLEPPSLDSQWLEQGFNGVSVVASAGNVFAHQRGVVQAVCRILKGGAGIEEQIGGSAVAAMPEDVFPPLAVGDAVALGGDP